MDYSDFDLWLSEKEEDGYICYNEEVVGTVCDGNCTKCREEQAIKNRNNVGYIEPIKELEK